MRSRRSAAPGPAGGTSSRIRSYRRGLSLFQVVSLRYERSSIILTSNKSVAEWLEVFGDHAIATAILDRLLHHSHVLSIKGNSYRLRERQMAAASAPQPVGAA